MKRDGADMKRHSLDSDDENNAKRKTKNIKNLQNGTPFTLKANRTLFVNGLATPH
jgi:hypothetical protein